MLKGLDSSAIKYVTAAPASDITAGGSSGASDFSAFTFGTLIVSVGSTAAAVVTVDVLRSSTSGGTFHNFGASITTAIANTLHVRSFALGSSDVFYKTFTANTEKHLGLDGGPGAEKLIDETINVIVDKLFDDAEFQLLLAEVKRM